MRALLAISLSVAVACGVPAGPAADAGAARNAPLQGAQAAELSMEVRGLM